MHAEFMPCLAALGMFLILLDRRMRANIVPFFPVQKLQSFEEPVLALYVEQQR